MRYDLAFLHGIHHGRNHRADRAERSHADRDKQHQRPHPRWIRHPIKHVRHKKHQNHQRNELDQSRHQRRDQNGPGSDGRHLEPAQNVLLAFLHRAQSRAEESGSEHADGQHHRHHLARAALLGVHDGAEHEKEDQREYELKEKRHAVAPSQPQIHLDLREISVHHDLVPQPFPRQLDEHIFERRLLQLNVIQVRARLIDPSEQPRQSPRRLSGINRQAGAVTCGPVGFFGLFKRRWISGRIALTVRISDARLVQRPSLNLPQANPSR